MRWNAHEDFQTCPQLPARANDLFVSVMIRGFQRVDLVSASGSGRIEAHDSVRVEFESTMGVRTARSRRRCRTCRATRVQITNGIRMASDRVPYRSHRRTRASRLACPTNPPSPLPLLPCRPYGAMLNREAFPLRTSFSYDFNTSFLNASIAFGDLNSDL